MACEICGKPSGFFQLCKECNELKKKGLVKRCESCGKWMKSTKPLCYECWKSRHPKSQNGSKAKLGHRDRLVIIYREVLKKAWEDGVITKDEAEILGQLRTNMGITDREHFELENNIKKEVKSAINILKKIERTKNELENDFRTKYPPKWRTKDGHIVRSKAERTIDDWFYENKIVHCYEKKLRGENIYCDFYLPYKGGIYVEFWGLAEQEEYRQRMIQKKEYYQSKGYKQIDILDKHMEDYDTHLEEIFKEILEEIEK
ncbi:MAG: hypothetical protein PHZ19_03045 [Candidatus Thermoplasmatota archaeon]|nr:hypothetical protein [Candidatus Thermoplasmatota archaeon]